MANHNGAQTVNAFLINILIKSRFFGVQEHMNLLCLHTADLGLTQGTTAHSLLETQSGVNNEHQAMNSGHRRVRTTKKVDLALERLYKD